MKVAFGVEHELVAGKVGRGGGGGSPNGSERLAHALVGAASVLTTHGSVQR